MSLLFWGFWSTHSTHTVLVSQTEETKNSLVRTLFLSCPHTFDTLHTNKNQENCTRIFFVRKNECTSCSHALKWVLKLELSFTNKNKMHILTIAFPYHFKNTSCHLWSHSIPNSIIPPLLFHDSQKKNLLFVMSSCPEIELGPKIWSVFFLLTCFCGWNTKQIKTIISLSRKKY